MFHRDFRLLWRRIRGDGGVVNVINVEQFPACFCLIGRRIQRHVLLFPVPIEENLRRNLIRMLDDLGLPQQLQIPTTDTLFNSHHDLLHSTSAIRYPVFQGAENYTGHAPSILKSVALKEFVERVLGPELTLVPGALIVPCGDAVDGVLRHLVDKGILQAERCLWGFPHPSGSNGHRVRYFAERRQKLTATIKAWFAR